MSSDLLRKSEQECRRIARSHYENFLVASVLLPGRLRQPFYNVYAFCRVADDLADESPTPEIASESLAQFRKSLDETFDAAPPDGIFPALADTIERFQLTKRPFTDLLDAFRQDQIKTRYRDFDELRDYCCRSANPVGRIVLSLTHSYSESNAKLSDEICTGLQLANFLQDIKRDFEKGRIYLPESEMRSHGVTEQMLRESIECREFRDLLRHECHRTEEFFKRGEPLLDRVPRWFARNLSLFIGGGRATLSAVVRQDYNVLSRRPVVSKFTQCRLLVRTLLFH